MSLAREVTLDQVVTVDNDQVVTETRTDDDVKSRLIRLLLLTMIK